MKKTSFIFKKPALLLQHLFTVHGTPHDIALGFALGVFLGVIPGTGPLAALVLAQLFRINRAAAILGAVLTNTWFSLVVMGLSAQVGAMITGVNLAELSATAREVFRPFQWNKLFALSFSRVIFPILTGYAIVSAALGFAAYLAVFTVLHLRKKMKKENPEKNQ